MASAIDSEIDRLYQLPPGEFTAARNALAKTAGKHAADVRRLAKPSAPAWAINQLYWKRHEDYNALVKASTELRKVHKAVLAGQRGDIREATKAHDAAIEQALKSTLTLLGDGGHPVTDATRHAIQTTLRALPADEPPGRLTRALQPGGFEMLTGMSIAPVRRGAFDTKTEPAHRKPPAGRDKTSSTRPEAKVKEDPKARQQAKEAAAKAARELRAAEHTAQREEFEAARAAREAEKAERTVQHAREAVEAAQKELEEAETNAREAERTRDATRRRAESAAAAVARLKRV
jgi:hypothetical protein